jgi:hypothetical protein
MVVVTTLAIGDAETATAVAVTTGMSSSRGGADGAGSVTMADVGCWRRLRQRESLHGSKILR